MKIISDFKNNLIPDEYGMNAGDIIEGINQRSFPFEITELPKSAKYVSFMLLDYDTTDIVGFAWIHWSVGDISIKSDSVKISDNFSLETNYPQGMNSLNSIVQKVRNEEWLKKNIDTNLVKRYAGPRPKSGIHNYRLTAFATSEKLNLTDGFYLSELMNDIDSVLIEQTSINFKYERKEA